MTHKRMTIGLITVMMLALGMSTGATAQITDTEPVGAQLVRPICGIDIYRGAGGFGSWTWNGTGYEETSGVTRLFVVGDFVSTVPGGCDVTVSFGGLTNPNGDSIGLSNFSAISYGPLASTARDPAGWTELGFVGSRYEFDLYLDIVPSGSPPGTYTGEIDVVVSNTV